MKTTIEAVLAKFPKVEGKRTPLTTWIKRIVTMEFPGVKFSVVNEHGSSIRVKWVDGPAEKEVKAIVGKFEHGHFDGMQDMYVPDTHSNPWIDAFGSVNYVFEVRDTSASYPVLKQALIEAGVDADGHDYHSASSAAWRMINATTIPNDKVIAGVKHNDRCRAGMIEDFYTVTFKDK